MSKITAPIKESLARNLKSKSILYSFNFERMVYLRKLSSLLWQLPISLQFKYAFNRYIYIQIPFSVVETPLWKLSVIITEAKASAVIVIWCYHEFQSSQKDNGPSRFASQTFKMMPFLHSSSGPYAYMHPMLRYFSHCKSSWLAISIEEEKNLWKKLIILGKKW